VNAFESARAARAAVTSALYASRAIEYGYLFCDKYAYASSCEALRAEKCALAIEGALP
jgi:hypothetical protein